MKAPHTSVFKDRDKEAKFWEENHQDTWKTGTPANVRFAKNLSETINIRLDSGTLNTVKYHARKKGLGPTQLIRMWIMEKLGGKTIQAAAA